LELGVPLPSSAEAAIRQWRQQLRRINTGGGVQYWINPHVAIEGTYTFHSVFVSGSTAKYSTVLAGVRYVLLVSCGCTRETAMDDDQLSTTGSTDSSDDQNSDWTNGFRAG